MATAENLIQAARAIAVTQGKRHFGPLEIFQALIEAEPQLLSKALQLAPDVIEGRRALIPPLKQRKNGGDELAWKEEKLKALATEEFVRATGRGISEPASLMYAILRVRDIELDEYLGKIGMDADEATHRAGQYVTTIARQPETTEVSGEESSEPEVQKKAARKGKALPPGAPVYDLLLNPAAVLDLPTLNLNVEAISAALMRKRRCSILLLGPRGVGKTFAMEQLAARIAAGRTFGETKFAAVLQVVSSALIEARLGATARNLRSLFEMANGLKGRVILFFDEIQGLMDVSEVSAKSEFKELLTTSRYPNVAVVAATTSHEFDIHIRPDRAMERRFSPVRIQSPSAEEEVDAVLVQARPLFPGSQQPTRDLVKHALELCRENFPTLPPIDGTLDLLDGAQALMRHSGGTLGVEEALSRASHQQAAADVLPAEPLDSVDRLIRHLRRHIVGQPHVVDKIATSYKQALLDIGRGKGPRHVFLFCGPSGTGKTHSARVYAQFLGKDNFVALAMSEYGGVGENGGQHAVNCLIGAGPSYKGSEQGGVLVNAVRDNPASVVLFDEIDQAHPDVQKLLYKILDEGEILDGYGNPVSFRNCTIFLTTNRGNAEPKRIRLFGASSDGGSQAMLMTRDEVLASLKDDFPQAFLNRIRTAVVFESLTRAQLGDVALLMIREAEPTILARTGLTLDVHPQVGDIFAALLGEEEDARAIDNVLKEHLWPRLNETLLKVRSLAGPSRKLALRADFDGCERELKVLLLDDEAAKVEQEIRAAAESAGLSLSLDASADPQKAEKLVHGKDLILLDLDWGQGRIGGVDILSRLRRIKDCPPVVIYSSMHRDELRTCFFREGAAGFIPKGDPRMLVEDLERTRRTLALEELDLKAPKLQMQDEQTKEAVTLTFHLMPDR